MTKPKNYENWPITWQSCFIDGYEQAIEDNQKNINIAKHEYPVAIMHLIDALQGKEELRGNAINFIEKVTGKKWEALR